MFPDDDDELSDAVRAAGAQLEARMTPVVIDELRQLGVYVDAHSLVAQWSDGEPRLGLVVSARVNRVAFSDRILNPEQQAVDDELAAMGTAMAADDYLDTYQDIQRRLADGKGLLDDGT